MLDPMSPETATALQQASSDGGATALPARQRNVATTLALLVGGFGVHKFYLGQRLQGWLYLIFSWTLIPGVLATFDALHYLRITDQAFEDRYGLSGVGAVASPSGSRSRSNRGRALPAPRLPRALRPATGAPTAPPAAPPPSPRSAGGGSGSVWP